MRAAVAFVAIVLLIVLVLLGQAFGRRLDHDEPVHVDARASTSTTVLTDDAVPDLGPRFDELVAAMRPKTRARARTAPTKRAAAFVDAGAWSCGGDLPPCSALNRENPNRDLTVYNGGCHHEIGYLGSNNPCSGRRASTASGKWQFVRETWARFKGYVNAADAPWQVQDEKARLVYAGGAGCFHWAAC